MIKRFNAMAVRRSPGEMNGMEKAYAQQLQILKAAGEIVSFSFESIKLKLAPKTFYEPDFMVVVKDLSVEIHEVKGHWEDDARVKIKVAAENFPFRFKAITKKSGQWIVEEFKVGGEIE